MSQTRTEANKHDGFKISDVDIHYHLADLVASLCVTPRVLYLQHSPGIQNMSGNRFGLRASAVRRYSSVHSVTYRMQSDELDEIMDECYSSVRTTPEQIHQIEATVGLRKRKKGERHNIQDTALYTLIRRSEHLDHYLKTKLRVDFTPGIDGI